MRWFDGHLDLTYLALHGRDLTRPAEQCGGTLQPASLTFPTLRAGGVRAAVSTLFVRRRTNDVDGPFCFDTPDEAYAAALRQVEMHRQWEAQGWIGKTKDERRRTKLAVVLAMEGAACVRDMEDLRTFHEAGVRVVALAWAEGSPWAGGDRSSGDVTPAGRQLITELDRLKCVHDVTHLSEKAFWTVMGAAKGVKVASHSNCRSLLGGAGAPHPERHLSDEQIRALAVAGGVIGINLFARFLIPPEALAQRRATIADVLAHIQHMEQVAGRRDFLALGSDMDSGFGRDLLPADLDGPEHLHRLAEALSASRWSDAEIERFAWGNWARVLGVDELTS